MYRLGPKQCKLPLFDFYGPIMALFGFDFVDLSYLDHRL